MRRVLIALAAIALMAAPSWADGGVGFFGTWADTQDADNTYGGGGILEFDLSPHWEIQFRGTRYVKFDTTFALPGDEFLNEGEEIDPATRSQEFDTTVLEFGAAYNFIPQGAFEIFVGGGFSYWIFDQEPPNSGEIKDEGGFYALVGAELTLTPNWGLFFEGMYRNVSATLKGDDLGFQPVNHELDMSGAAINVGLMFKW